MERNGRRSVSVLELHSDLIMFKKTVDCSRCDSGFWQLNIIIFYLLCGVCNTRTTWATWANASSIIILRAFRTQTTRAHPLSKAMIAAEDNDTSVQSQSERTCLIGYKPSQAMRAAAGNPRGGENQWGLCEAGRYNQIHFMLKGGSFYDQ